MRAQGSKAAAGTRVSRRRIMVASLGCPCYAAASRYSGGIFRLPKVRLATDVHQSQARAKKITFLVSYFSLANLRRWPKARALSSTSRILQASRLQLQPDPFRCAQQWIRKTAHAESQQTRSQLSLAHSYKSQNGHDRPPPRPRCSGGHVPIQRARASAECRRKIQGRAARRT